ncbi:MAG: ATP-binding protein [Bacillota bacterium]|nr:ATP-binding protein [Bacillota bacterium]MDW7683677.1 ATP-binding protein [Bacillota bacterium]
MYLPRRNSLGWRYLWVLSIIIAGLMTLNFVWSNMFFRQTEFEKLREKADVITEQFIAMRYFIAQSQDKINYDSHGNFEFKHLNPAAVGRGVGDILAKRTQYSIKQTWFDVRNPDNEPDDYELEALRQFEENPALTAIDGEYSADGRTVYRYIVPLYIEESCLDCHGGPAGTIDVTGYTREGLSVGELAGIISVTMPTETVYATLANNRNNMLLFSLLLLIATLTGILYVTSRMVVQPLDELKQRVLLVGKGELDTRFDDISAYGEIATLSEEFQSMLGQLKDLYKTMERRVMSRTRELEAANLRLTEGKRSLVALNQKLSENSRIKSEFMATITHELRTPLTSIVAFCELLLDEIPGPVNEEQRENLLDIKTSAQQLMLLISDILDMTKLEAGKLRLEKEKVELNDVFRVVRRTMTPIAYQNNIRLDVARVELPLAYADPERLRQMINNLISNSIKFTKEDGRIYVWAEAEEKNVAIHVEDTGEGIPPDLLPHIFEKFRQGDASLKRRRSGTGLGLALVKTLAELQGGSVSVSSEMGKGTKFTIRVPIAKDEGGE